MKPFLTEQEEFWAGKFGDDYILRNNSEDLLQNRIAFFKNILLKTAGVSSVIEFGANIGLNLIAIRKTLPNTDIAAVELNEKAIEQLRVIPGICIYSKSIFDFNPDKKWDLVLVRGILIHINPVMLDKVYQKIYDSCVRYVLLAEYYSPNPEEVLYRGNTGMLFKRDFAGEMLDKYSDLHLVDYGFKYYKENKYNDDITWFLLEKPYLWTYG